MTYRKISFLLIGIFMLLAVASFAQQPPFYDEIQAFKKQDSINPPPQHAILFIGSSSFRKWADVQSYFPGYKIINRGFGGSTIPDVIRYANDIIFPYKPKQIVFYCGDNDLAASNTITADSVYNRFKQFVELVRSRLPGTNITFVSIKPSPSRENLMPEMEKANDLIRNYLKSIPNTFFVDVYHRMLNGQGRPRGEIFLDDSLHMNQKGYEIWQKSIQPTLIISKN